MSPHFSKPTVAIACQGGGSHAAFTAGVLARLFEPELFSRFELVALTGTSGGAVCAALAWAGLAAGGPAEARRRLLDFWHELEADDPIDATVNAMTVLATRVPGIADWTPQPFVSPAEIALRALLEKHARIDALSAAERERAPAIFVGATDVLAGTRRVFRAPEIGVDAILASAAVPRLFRAMPVDGALYWDGLFACNPPIRELTDLAPPPDQIWVVRLNPKRRANVPVLLNDVVDRINELSGNLALDQELSFVAKINELRRAAPELAHRYKHIEVREIELDQPQLDYASKFDRSPPLIETLLAHGAERAARLLEPTAAAAAE